MPIDVKLLSSLASEYANGMTSIRGRRVQRLLKREFAGAAYVLIVEVESRGRAVLGISESGAGFCSTDGRGKLVSVTKWLHGSTEAIEIEFDLLRDSLPVLGRCTIPFSALPRRRAALHVPAGFMPPGASHLASLAFQALA